MNWFRFYNDALDDPKVQRLPPPLFKVWVNLLCLASKNQGQLPQIDDIAYILRITPTEATDAVADLIAVGILDKAGTGSLQIHDWGRHERPDGDRYTGTYKAWRKAVLGRDAFTCQNCGVSADEGAKLHAHHLLPYKSHLDKRFRLDNGVTLCAPCHYALHARGGK